MSTLAVQRKISIRRRSSNLSNTTEKREARKIIIAGSTRCGKTALVQRFLNGFFSQNYIPTVEDFYSRDHRFKDNLLNIEIVDMCGPNMFPLMRDMHIQTASVAMLIYEIDNKTSIQEAADVLTKIKELRADMTPLPVVLVGTKLDLFRRHDEENVYEFNNERFSMMHDLDRNHVLTSAKDNIKVGEAFELALEHVLESYTLKKSVTKPKGKFRFDKIKGCIVN